MNNKGTKKGNIMK